MSLDSNQYHWFRYRNGKLIRAGLARRRGQAIDPPKPPRGATYFGAHTQKAIRHRSLFVL